MPEVIAVNPEHLDKIWDNVEPLLKEVEERANGTWTMKTMKASLEEGVYHLWLVGDSVIVTTITEYGACFIVAACGTKKELIAGLPTIEKWAKSVGLNTMEFVGRKGWVKDLPDYKKHVYMVKGLNDE